MRLVALPGVSAASLRVSQHRLGRRLGYPDSAIPEGRPRELIGEARRVFEEDADPWRRAVEVDVARKSGTEIALGNDVVVCSPVLARRIELAREPRAVVVVVTLGETLDRVIERCWAEERCDLAWFLEAYAAAAVSALLAETRAAIGRVLDRAGIVVMPQYCPGYEGWELREQFKLIGLIESATERAMHIRILDSGMLVPAKSILGVCPLTRDAGVIEKSAAWNPCETCTIHDCACMKTRSA